MIELKRDQMEKAIEKAKQNRCHVRAIAWRKYEVRTPEGKLYQVTFDVDSTGRKLAGCNCKAGENERVCYHAAAAVQAHCMIARMKAEHEPLCLPDAPPAETILASAAASGPAFGIVALVNQLREAVASVEADVEPEAPPASEDDQLVEDLIDDDPDFWEAQGLKRPRPGNRVAELQARSAQQNQPTWHQMVAIKAIAKDKGLDAEAECQRIFQCAVSELNRRAAKGFIAKLRDARAAQIEEKPEGILIKQQPISLGRIGGYEL